MKRRRVLLPLAAVGATLASTLVGASPASAHGYVSDPPSRQAQCAQGIVADCGAISYEPQSVEAPKGSLQCNGGQSSFAVLNDDTRGWRATPVGRTVSFNWVLTARHATSTWEYFVGGTRIAVFDDAGRRPGATVSHTVDLGGRTGRQTVLARWNVADTPMAFYACVDLQVGGGGGTPTPTAPTPTAPTTPPATTPPPATPPATTPPATGTPTTPPPTGGTWSAGTAYAVGSTVTHGGVTYRCRLAHTALPGWEPPNVPALWQRV